MSGASDRRGRRRLRRILLGVVAALFVLSIPWYRTAGEEPIVWLGLPGWVAVALLCYVGAALANAAAWLLTDVPDAPPASDAETAREPAASDARGGDGAARP